MAIDLNSCNGCNACVVACQSENNIPVVGKDQVMRGREMHWIRMTVITRRKRANDPSTNTNDALANPPTFFQPVPCMQCENAPCEQVCPVGATVHSAEGLNDMVYNRCIGTRYCSNNCPYKVRRFNFLRFQDWETPQLKLLRNPEVTVRSRGVMEKCTYCVQRINNCAHRRGKRKSADSRRRNCHRLPACMPQRGHHFWKCQRPDHPGSKLKAQQRQLFDLRRIQRAPRTTYLAAVRNPNSDLAAPPEKA